MVPRKAPVVGFGGAMAGLPVWVDKKRRIKKQRDGQALTLGGHQSMTITNNQQIVGRSGRGDVRVEARGWESVWGATVPLFGAAIQTMKKYIYIKYFIGFGWPLINNGSHNNQSKIGVHNGVKNGEEVQRAGGV